MPDENLMRSILDAQKRLQPYIDVAEAARCYIQPFDSAGLRVIEQNRGVVEMVRNMSVFDTHALLLKEPEWVRQMREIESRFRLPEIPEISGLMRDIAAGPVAKLLNESSSLQRAIEDMRSPWLEVEQQIRSMTGLSELQSIGRALENIPTFDESLVTALRFDLGDWRDSISWKPEIFVDWEARSAFYESLGFNKALTCFPAPAFEQSLDIARLRRTAPALVGLYGDPVPVKDGEDTEDSLVGPHTAYGWLFGLETELRAFIDEEMTRAFGADWPKRRLPNGLHDKWVEKKKKAVQAGGIEMPLIAYADFTDYELVICKSDNWRVVFIGFFRRLESVRESLQRLYPIRICAMHARPITKDDELLLYVETKRLRKAFKR